MAKPSADAIAYSAAALQSGDVQEALEVRNREFRQATGSFDESIVRTMQLILTCTPQMLADCPTEVVEPLRVAAAMMELWGTNTIRDFVTIDGEIDYRLDAQKIAHMLHMHGNFLRAVKDFRGSGITRVELIRSGNSRDCKECRALGGKLFSVDEVPELPLATCRCKDGCALWVVAVK